MSSLNFTTGTNSAKIIHRSSDPFKYEIWYIRIPSKQKGKSGGFRLVCIRDISRSEVLLWDIESRKELTKPKNQRWTQDAKDIIVADLYNVSALSDLI